MSNENTRSTLLRSEIPGIEADHRGKVRDLYRLGDRMVIVATDRISAYDVVLPNGIPGKGIVLTQLSRFWFDKLGGICPNHCLSCSTDDMPEPFRRPELEGRSMLVELLEMVQFECVVRGYLAGSGWREYQKTGEVCGIRLPEGLRLADQLPEPIFTPATKAEEGHDINVSRAYMADAIGEELTASLEKASLDLYRSASGHAREKGLILADTKFEFGRREGGEIVLGDEVFSSDSSRYWDAKSWTPGETPREFDKQFVRDYLDSTGWDKKPPGPELPSEVVQGTMERYYGAYAQLTGKELPFPTP